MYGEAKSFSDHKYENFQAYTIPVYLQIWQRERRRVYKIGVAYLCSPRDVEVCELHLINSTE